MAHLWSSEDIYTELVLPVLLHVGSGDQTQMVGLMTSNLYPLKHLPGPWLYSSPPHGQPEERRCDLKLPFLFTTREEVGVLLRLVFRG